MYSKKIFKKNFQKRIKLFIYLFHILKKDILEKKIFLFRQALQELILIYLIFIKDIMIEVLFTLYLCI